MDNLTQLTEAIFQMMVLLCKVIFVLALFFCAGFGLVELRERVERKFFGDDDAD